MRHGVFRDELLFAALFVYFMSPKANCAIYSAQLLYVSASRGGLPYFGEFFPVNRVIYSSLCAFMPPKVNCAIYSAWLVYVCACIPLCVCEPHLLQIYGCIDFEDGSSTGSSPGAKFGENPEKKKAIAICPK